MGYLAQLLHPFLTGFVSNNEGVHKWTQQVTPLQELSNVMTAAVNNTNYHSGRLNSRKPFGMQDV